MTKKLKRGGMQWLHLTHIVSTSIWFGSVVCIGALAIVIFFQLSETDFLTIAPLIPMLYQKVILPIALLTIIQGIIYGVFTNWGFLKYKWVTFKWCLIPLIVLSTGLGTIGSILSLLDRVETVGFVGGWADGGFVLLFIFLQILLMFFMFVLSIFKPFKSKQKAFKK